MTLPAACFNIKHIIHSLVISISSLKKEPDKVRARCLSMRSRYLLSVILFTIAFTAVGQNRILIDSLQKEVNSSNQYTTFIALTRIAFEYRLSDPDSTLIYCNKAIDLGKELGYTYQLAQPSNIMGVVYMNQGLFDKAHEHFQKALALALPDQDLQQAGHANNNLGRLFSELGDEDIALSNFKNAMHHFQRMNDASGIAYVYHSMATSYERKLNYDSAIYMARQSYDKRKLLHDKRQLLSSLGKMAVIYRKMGEFDKALACLSEADSLVTAIVDKLRYTEIKLNQAQVYFEMHKPAEARSYLRLAEVALAKIRNTYLFAQFMYLKGMISLDDGKEAEAISNFRFVVDELPQLTLNEKEKSAEMLIQLLTKVNQPAEAEKYKIRLENMRNKMENSSLLLKLEKMSMQAKLDESEKNQQRLFIQNQQRNNTLVITIGALIILLIGAVSFIIININKTKEARRFAETERSLARKLEESEEHSRRLVEDSMVAFCTHDEDGNILTVNKFGASVLGYTPKEMIGMNFKKVVPLRYQQSFDQYLNEIKSRGRSSGFWKIIHKDGKERTFLYHNIKIERKGKKTYYLGSQQDVTEWKTAEKELKLAKEQAETANAAKSEFLANVSHELRTPLNGVIGFTDLLSKTKLNETQQKYVSVASDSAHSLLSLIEDILEFAKLEAGKLQLTQEKTNLTKLSNQVVDMVNYQATKKGISMKVEIDPMIPELVMADEFRLRQVLTNLLSNAVKFTDQGGVELKLKMLTPNRSQKISIRFSVKDTGIGIAPENQRKIFDAFIQEDISITKRFGGTGLGLTISNKLLILMQSELNVESEVGKGSVFSFDLDLTTPS